MSCTYGDKTVIDLDILKQKYVHDSLPHHLWYLALDCKKRRDAFWRHYRRMRIRNNMISIPLLVTTGLSGITSIAQVGTVEKDKTYVPAGLPIVISIFSMSAAILTTLQRYFHYAERAEHCKNMAKNYARLAKRIENNLVLIESAAVKIEPTTFLKFMEDVQKDVESLLQQMEELPYELITNTKTSYDSMMKEVKDSRKQVLCSGPINIPLSDIQDAVMNFTDRGTSTAGSDLMGQITELTINVKQMEEEIKTAEANLAVAVEEARPEEILKVQLHIGMLKETLRKHLMRIDELSKNQKL